MPYSGPDDTKLPSNVKKMGDKERRRWVAVFNSAYSRCSAKGGKSCETFAFKNANGVLKNASTTYTGLLGGEVPLGRSFIELQAAEPPDTINIFPAPGTYKHPIWGDIEVTEAGNMQFIENFNAQVYQEHVPIDAEHETKLSGAVGYIKKLSMNDDGSIEAEVNWTDRGSKLIEDDSYKYISPEWFETWTDPATAEEHQNVLIGAALTTRPFFKGLRSLVASEGRLYDLEDDERVPVIRSTVEGVSYNDLQTMVMSAARHEFPGLFGSSYGSYIVDLWDDYAVVCGGDGSEYYRIDFSYDDAGGITFSGQPTEVMRKIVWEPEDGSMKAKDYSADKRKELAGKGQALPDGSYPIVNSADLMDAIHAFGRAKNKEAVKRHIIKRAKALGKTSMLPADWPGSTKKEASMTVPTKASELDLTKLDQKEQDTLFRRLGRMLFGHDPDNSEDAPDRKSEEEEKTEDKNDETENQEEPVTAAEITSLRGALVSERKAREASDKRVQGLEEESRTRRYRDIVLGRDEASVRQAQESNVPVYPMVGDHAAKMQIMRALAAKGEDSAEFKAYIAAEREHARQLHESGTFNEVGADSQGQPASSSPVDEFERRITTLTAGDSKLSRTDAIAKIASEDPKLYDAYDRAVSGRKGRFVGTGS